MRVAEEQVFDPDFMLLERKPGGYWDELPTIADVAFIIEVAETSLQRDLQAKLPVYAAADLQEYWIIDIPQQRVIVHRLPQSHAYTDVTTYGRDQQIAPLVAPELLIGVGQLFA